ncbi:hypothetical protein V3391_00945 [Luteimonas sp. SMYT11W]|uniref:Uncharacterized protein n=2 Tax=Luteimonas flava TaxID=3115822 RepID=A0ABU7WAL4_9GAMM
MLRDMAADLTTVFPVIGAMVEGFKKNGSRSSKWMHQYTHGGTPQLTRRDPIGNWTDFDIALTLVRAEMFGLLAPAAEGALSGKADLLSFVFDRREAIAFDLNRIFGLGELGEGERAFPEPDKRCCGDPLFS